MGDENDSGNYLEWPIERNFHGCWSICPYPEFPCIVELVATPLACRPNESRQGIVELQYLLHNQFHFFAKE